MTVPHRLCPSRGTPEWGWRGTQRQERTDLSDVARARVLEHEAVKGSCRVSQAGRGLTTNRRVCRAATAPRGLKAAAGVAQKSHEPAQVCTTPVPQRWHFAVFHFYSQVGLRPVDNP